MQGYFWFSMFGAVVTFFWSNTIMFQMLIFDLITMLLIFQAKFPVEELNVLQEVYHSRKERCKLKTFSIAFFINFIYALWKIILPLAHGIEADWYNESSMYTVILTTDVLFFGSYFVFFVYHSKLLKGRFMSECLKDVVERHRSG